MTIARYLFIPPSFIDDHRMHRVHLPYIMV